MSYPLLRFDAVPGIPSHLACFSIIPLHLSKLSCSPCKDLSGDPAKPAFHSEEIITVSPRLSRGEDD